MYLQQGFRLQLCVRKTSLLGLYVSTCSCCTEEVNKRAISSFLWMLSYDYSYIVHCAGRPDEGSILFYCSTAVLKVP